MDKKWLNFAGLLHKCIYNRENQACPYNQFRKMDQMEKLEKILTIKNSEARQMMESCHCLRSQCQAVIPFSLQNLSVINSKMDKTAMAARV
jgi:hypothetical protein